MKSRIVGLALVALALGAGAALARNYHCAGGIQYVIQGEKEKDRGNMDDAHRIFGKAVAQLTECVKEDPNDNESWSYLGWAYAELDSAEQAGKAFDEGETRLANDPKKLATLHTNRKAFWVQYYNAGLSKYKEAGNFMKVEDIVNSTGPQADSARARLAESETAFRKAVAVSAKEIGAYNNLAIVLGLQGKFDEAEQVVERGLAIDPNNQDLKDRKESMVGNEVVRHVQSGDYDGALALLDGLLAKRPNDFNNLVLAAQTSFEKGDKTKDKDAAGAKAAYAKAEDYYGRASDNAPDDKNKHDMKFNQAIAAQNAGDDLAEAKIVFGLLQDSPKERNLHQMLRSAYDRLGSKKKTDDEVWVILGLNDNATAVADIAGYTAKLAKTSDAAKTLAAQGPPEEIKQFKTEQTLIDIWYYWTKKLAFAFSGGRQVGSANFGEFGPETFDKAAPAGTTPAKAPAKAPAKPAPKPPVKKG